MDMNESFNLIVSNRLEELSAELSRMRLVNSEFFRATNSLFEPESITVATRGMGIWLEQQLVKRGHVVANLQFPFIRDTIERILVAYLEAYPPEEGTYAPELFAEQVLAWRIFAIFQAEDAVPETLKTYIGTGSYKALRAFQLARKLAKLFYDYQSFIPEKLSELNSKSSNWQGELWEKLCRDSNGNKLLSTADVMVKFLSHRESLAGLTLAPITFFGISAMPERFLQVLKKASEVTRVNFFYLDPCREYWADETKKNFKSVDVDELQYHNRLLAHLGQQGRRFFKAVTSLDKIHEHEVQVDEEPNTLLKKLQSDIFRLETTAWTLEATDDSLTFHSCIGDMRQVEALHDALCHIFKTNKDVSLNDVIVMAPDISKFAPAIKAVFDQGPFKDKYVVTDRSLKSANLMAETFLELLELKYTNLTVTQVAKMLDSHPLRLRFDIDDACAAIIKNWLLRTNVKWLECTVETDDRTFTWEQALDRLLLNLAMPREGDETGPSFMELSQVEFPVNEETLHALSALIRLIDELKAFKEKLSSDYTASEWVQLLGDARPQFFKPDGSSTADYGCLGQTIQEFGERTELAGLTDKVISFEVVKSSIEGALEMVAPGEPFLKGNITFCSLLPMRSIPCHTIAILGLQEGDFPRQDENLNYSLIDPESLKYYDSSHTSEDRYSFLEAMLAAKEKLLLFYNGHSDTTLEELLPATPVDELIDYVRDIVGADAANQLVKQHRLNAFDPVNFQPSSEEKGPLLQYFSFDSAAARLANKVQAGIQKATLPPLYDGIHNLNPVELPFELENDKLTIDIKDLERFLKSPTEAFLQTQLKFPRVEWDRGTLSATEPFVLSALDSALPRRQIAEMQAKEEPSDTLGLIDCDEPPPNALGMKYTSMKANAKLPMGTLGKAAFHNLQYEARTEGDFRDAYHAQVTCEEPFEFSLELGEIKCKLNACLENCLCDATGTKIPENEDAEKINVTLTGTFKAVPDANGNPIGAYDTPLATLTHHLIGPYLKHLMICADNPDDNQCIISKVLNKNQKEHQFDDFKSDEALEQLKNIVQLYLIGHIRPLPLFKMASPIKDISKLPDDIQDDPRIKMLYGWESENDLNDQWKKAFEEFATFAYMGNGIVEKKEKKS
jgi:exodeoxyribonuclease V gamma subunit